jgi:hypothetical protein
VTATADRWVSAFFIFGVGAFMVFNWQNIADFADRLVKTGVGLSQGLASVKAG